MAEKKKKLDEFEAPLYSDWLAQFGTSPGLSRRTLESALIGASPPMGGEQLLNPALREGIERGRAVDVLGIPSAIRALRGGMSEEEQEGFGIEQLLGLGGAGLGKAGLAALKLIPKHKAGLGKVKEIEWGNSEKAIAEIEEILGKSQTSPAVKKYDPEMLAAMEKAGIKPGTPLAEATEALWQSKPSPVSKAPRSDPAKEALDNIEKAMRIPPSPKTTEGVLAKIKDALVGPMKEGAYWASDLPKEIPFGIPERGRAVGFNMPLAHGTTKMPREVWEEYIRTGKLPQNLEKDFGKFALPKDEIGVHAGSSRGAAEFTERGPSPTDFPRTFPLATRAQNPLEMRDLGSWGPEKIFNELKRLDFPAGEVHRARYGKPDEMGVYTHRETPEQIQGLRDYIKSKGYDSIKYVNKVEDPGHTSYIFMDTSQIRVPWAKFDPARLSESDLLAGLAGASAVGGASLATMPEWLPKEYRRQ